MAKKKPHLVIMQHRHASGLMGHGDSPGATIRRVNLAQQIADLVRERSGGDWIAILSGNVRWQDAALDDAQLILDAFIRTTGRPMISPSDCDEVESPHTRDAGPLEILRRRMDADQGAVEAALVMMERAIEDDKAVQENGGAR